MGDLIITAALTGGIIPKEANPSLPTQPHEIISQAIDCWNAGAAVVHLHARDKKEVLTMDVNIFREINEGIRSRCNIIIQDTTGGGMDLTPEERIQSIEADPEMASLNTGTLTWTKDNKDLFFINTRSEIEYFAKKMLEKKIKPEMEVYNIAMLKMVENLIEKGLVEKPYYVNFVLGTIFDGGLPGTPENLLACKERLPRGCIFNVTGIGKTQTMLATLSILIGGHVRVGMEDNFYISKGELAKNNAQFVEKIVNIAQFLGREIATPNEARKILNIQHPSKKK